MAFPLKRALRRGREWARSRPDGGHGIIVPFFRPILRRRRYGADAPTAFETLSLVSGNMEVRLARDAADIDAVQALRYRVFYGELGAKPTSDVAAAERDVDSFDAHCEHLMVVDRSNGEEAVVGTYRLLRRRVAENIGGFYTQDEYNIRKLLRGRQEVLELGRSCVDPAHRRSQTMQLLWRGIAEFIQHYDIALMFGCASFHGTDPAEHAMPLSYLYYNHLAPAALRPKAVRDRYVDMRLLPPEAVDPKAALSVMPPLIKGYLRLGGFVGDGAVVDHDFNTIDVCVVVKTDWVTSKYVRRYSREDSPLRSRLGT